MKYYRVSRNKYYVGDRIWENQISESSLERIYQYFYYIVSGSTPKIIENLIRFPRSVDALKEAHVELGRILKYKDFPNRWENMMVFLEENDAKNFLLKFRPGGYIYEVASNIQGAIFDMRMLDSVTENSNEGFRLMVERYWNQEKTPDPILEIILNPGSDVFIIKEVD